MKRTIVDDLVALPWWSNLVLALVVYIGLRFLLPGIALQSPLLRGISLLLPQLAWLFAGLLVFIAFVSLYHKWQRGELLDSQTSIKTIKALSWKDFEYLVSEAYRRKGFTVRENAGAGADGGIDLVISKDGKTILIQCKNWRAKSVGVTTVRELYGVLVAEKASEGVIVCSGNFTRDAIEFAQGKSLTLIDGSSLLRLIGDVQKTNNMSKSPNYVFCPVCESPMVLRASKKGRNAGEKFWGCSNFPKCRGTRGFNPHSPYRNK